MNFRLYFCSFLVFVVISAAIVSGKPVHGPFSDGILPVPTPIDGVAKIGFSGYRGVNIGSTAIEARSKLGEPREKSDQQDYYVVGEGENTQVLYDADKTVKTISISYFGGAKSPTPMDLFGADAEVKPDGSINKMVKFAKAGYSILYIRTAGDDPIVMVTIQKVGKEQ